MNPKLQKPWYKKKLYWAAGGILGLSLVAGLGVSSTPTAQPSVSDATLEAAAAAVNLQAPSAPTSTPPQNASATTTHVTIPSQPSSVQLSNDHYYTNVDGNNVHSPASAPSTPAGATAQCKDGTYSFSQHRSGTCSHHGGVASWL